MFTLASCPSKAPSASNDGTFQSLTRPSPPQVTSDSPSAVKAARWACLAWASRTAIGSGIFVLLAGVPAGFSRAYALPPVAAPARPVPGPMRRLRRSLGPLPALH